MFYISSKGLKKMASDTRKFAFVGSGVNAVTNIIGWAVMKDGYSPLLVAAVSVLWFIAFQFGALILYSIAETSRNSRHPPSASGKQRPKSSRLRRATSGPAPPKIVRPHQKHRQA